MKGQDDQLHSLEIDADGLFAAAFAGIQEWQRLWWFSTEAIIEVRTGQQCWMVKARRVNDWYSK
jgi:hypothetical protein